MYLLGLHLVGKNLFSLNLQKFILFEYAEYLNDSKIQFKTTSNEKNHKSIKAFRHEIEFFSKHKFFIQDYNYVYPGVANGPYLSISNFRKVPYFIVTKKIEKFGTLFFRYKIF